MRTNLATNVTTQFRVLSDDQIEAVYLAALEMLERTGTRVLEAQSRKLLAKAGAIFDGEIARIPSGIVKRSLTSVPPRVALGDRDGKRSMILESHRIYYGTGSDCPFIIDAKNGKRRQFLKKDIEDAARVANACGNIDFHMSLGLMSDVSTYSYDRHQAAAMIRNTTKPLVFTAMSREGLSDILDMYYLIRGSREAFETNPGFVIYLEPTSPLINGKAVLEKLLFSAKRRIPAIYTPCPIGGATAPVTMAGILAQTTAEFLVGMVVSQLASPGAPLIMGGVVSIMDMRTMIYAYGAPEMHLLSAALADVAHWLGVPMFSTAGCSDAKCLDEQAAIEAALSIMAAGLSGANLIHDIGFLESALVGSHEMVVMCDEVVGMVKRFLGGVTVNDDTLATEVVNAVGPGGNFVAEEHTVRHLRSELWFPKLMDRTRYDAWKTAGAKTLGDRVRERVKEILKTHKVEPLPESVNAGIDKILAAADKKANASQVALM